MDDKKCFPLLLDEAKKCEPNQARDDVLAAEAGLSIDQMTAVAVAGAVTEDFRSPVLKYRVVENEFPR